MPKRIRLRTLTTDEIFEVRRLAKSRKEPMRLVQRAKVISAMLSDPDLPASQAGMMAGFVSDVSGSFWVRRFNKDGFSGLADKPRSGKPVIHTQEVRSQLIDLALQKPRSKGYPFELWTLTRLQQAFKERCGLLIARSAIWKWLSEEGLDWKRQQSWFHDAADHDVEFVEKRGP